MRGQPWGRVLEDAEGMPGVEAPPPPGCVASGALRSRWLRAQLPSDRCVLCEAKGPRRGGDMRSYFWGRAAQTMAETPDGPGRGTPVPCGSATLSSGGIMPCLGFPSCCVGVSVVPASWSPCADASRPTAEVLSAPPAAGSALRAVSELSHWRQSSSVTQAQPLGTVSTFLSGWISRHCCP